MGGIIVKEAGGPILWNSHDSNVSRAINHASSVCGDVTCFMFEGHFVSEAGSVFHVAEVLCWCLHGIPNFYSVFGVFKAGWTFIHGVRWTMNSRLADRKYLEKFFRYTSVGLSWCSLAIEFKTGR